MFGILFVCISLSFFSFVLAQKLFFEENEVPVQKESTKHKARYDRFSTKQFRLLLFVCACEHAIVYIHCVFDIEIGLNKEKRSELDAGTSFKRKTEKKL